MARQPRFERLRAALARGREKIQSATSRDKEAFWKPRAIAAINEVHWETLYSDDGRPNRLRLSDPRYDDMPPDENPITGERVLALGERIGYDELTAAVREKIYMQDLYWERNERDKATRRWLHRREDLPDWFWWYHGVSS